jgi:IS5 family transposase
MGYKRIGEEISFADLAVSKSLEHNRSVKLMDRINKVVRWKNIEALLLEYYDTGKTVEGADAYPPILLLKCMLLQQWFRIPSDPELENQINDRISFKKFLGLPMDKPSPDHSTFSRFRSRLTKEAMLKLNNVVLQEFAKRGLSINEGMAVDARLVKSASRPLSNDGIKEEREKRNSVDGKVDKNGNPLKFSRDIESDWVIKNDEPHYGLKEHASVDVENGFILATTMTPASASGPVGAPARRVHDTNYLPYLAIASCHTEEPIEKIYADKGYFGEPNRFFLNLNGIKDGIMRKDTKTAKLTKIEIERNKQISKKRYIVEQYFGLSHLHNGFRLVELASSSERAKRARFTTIIKNTWDAMCRQMAFNMKRGSRLLATA